VKWSSELIAGITDDELLPGTLLFACARTCGTKSNAADGTSNEPNNLVAFSTPVLIGLRITGSLAIVYSIVDVAFLGLERRRPRWAQHNPMKREQTGCQVARVPSTGYKCLVRGTLEMETHILSTEDKGFFATHFLHGPMEGCCLVQ